MLNGNHYMVNGNVLMSKGVQNPETVVKSIHHAYFKLYHKNRFSSIVLITPPKELFISLFLFKYHARCAWYLN